MRQIKGDWIMGQLDIYRASAGSGKTHTLAHKYVRILLDAKKKDDEVTYKNILAVTFTNKATEEMKSRIVSILYKLSKGDKTELKEMGHLPAKEVQERAKTILTAILHDYSNFQVSTIDRFFQQVFRAFARELGSFSNYRVELSDEDVLSHAIDEMLSGMDDVSKEDADKLYKIINGFALDQWRYNNKPKYTDQLLDFAKLFIKEDFKKKAADYKPEAEAIDRVGRNAAAVAAKFEKDLKDLANEAMAAMAAQGLTVDDFPYRQKGGMGQVQKYAAGEIKVPGQRLISLEAEGCNNNPGICALLTKIIKLFGGEYAKYRTAVIIRNNLGVMKIFGGIYDALESYLKENNIMLLGETTDALHKMTAGSDTPFIYERIGTRIDHYLLDEFQDFSLMQWDNFKPLLADSLDKGYDNLIVGDVKQSIYRWRSSDWNTLESGVDKDLKGKNISSKPLNVNYRSDKVIVDFNNDFFYSVTRKDGGAFDGDETIDKVYSDCRQTSKSECGGHVKVTFFEGKDENDDVPSLAMLKGEIGRLEKMGYPLSDVYILVRTNREAAAAAARLIADGYDVITEESLVVGTSGYVQRIIAVLKYMVNPQDAVNTQILKEMGLDVDAVDLSGNSLYDVCENIVRSLGEELMKGQMPYLMTFMDVVLDYMRDRGSDISGFVKWWEDTGCKQAISAPKGANAVRIMTIHKAKGLGCPVVIMPFFHEALAPGSLHANYMWCKEEKEFDTGLMPVAFRSDVSESSLNEYYDREALYYKMDALNTAYVAFTRAEHELIVFAKLVPSKPGISNKLQDYLAGKLDGDVYEVGESVPYVAGKEDSIRRLCLSGYNSIPMEGTDGKKRLALIYRGSDFFDPEGRDAARRRGIVMHDILSRINTEADVASSVDAAVAGGELAAAERDDTIARVGEMLDSVKSYGWFSGEGDILNELSIIDTDGQVYRPDRVILSGGNAVVVDYKFGERHGGYRKQVGRYMDMLRQMGYEKVEGYLWYAAENNIEKVA
jgi:ATP-dependent exoDNAse (exonuclease V) beta subunit